MTLPRLYEPHNDLQMTYYHAVFQMTYDVCTLLLLELYEANLQ